MSIIDQFPPGARKLLIVRGDGLLTTLGLPALRAVVSQVLCGVNIRNATEALTRQRINLLNAALLVTYSNLARKGVNPGDIPSAAYDDYKSTSANKEDKIVLRWMLGLTTKQVENVLRSNESAWVEYIRKLEDGMSASAQAAETDFGPLSLSLSDAESPELDWEWALSLLMAIGAQTLAVRGSEKSLYGKFFEKMVMGSVLSVLGFSLSEEDSLREHSFWLSSRGRKRESDATAIWSTGKGVRFDIGFIGVGNPEITLDKVSRFEREIEFNGVPHSMRTIIIVDRVAKGSRIIELAEKIDGRVIQMSASNWVKTLGQELELALPGYKSPFNGMDHLSYVKAIETGVAGAPLEEIFSVALSGDNGASAEVTGELDDEFDDE